MNMKAKKTVKYSVVFLLDKENRSFLTFYNSVIDIFGKS